MARIVVSQASSTGELFRAFCVLYDASESPAEILMLSHLWRAVCALPWRETDLAISAQVEVGKYRADFLLEARGRKVAIEVDGRQHRETADAIAYDIGRDRDFAAHHIEVLRFTCEEVLDTKTASAVVLVALQQLTAGVQGAA